MNSKYKYDFENMGKRITRARQQANITQEEAAHNIGISVKHYSEIERGVTGISLGMLITIIQFFDTSADYILLGDYNDKSPLSKKIKKLIPQQRKYLDDVLNGFVNCCLNIKQI